MEPKKINSNFRGYWISSLDADFPKTIFFKLRISQNSHIAFELCFFKSRGISFLSISKKQNIFSNTLIYFFYYF